MSSKSKTASTTTNQTALNQYNDAKSSLPTAYSALSGSQINNYMNPYQSAVTDATLKNLDTSRQMALNQNNDQAIKAGAFGGTGASVERALTQGQYDQNAATTLAGLNSSNYAQALQTAQAENTASNQYPLAIQQLLGQLAQGTSTTSKGSSTPSEMQTGGQLLQTGASLAAMFSDERLKRDIKPLGERKGRKWYEFKYLWDDIVREGVMAQENLDIATMQPCGFYTVDYRGIV